MEGTAGVGFTCTALTWLSTGVILPCSCACPCTMTASVSLLLPVTDPDASAGDVQRLPVDETGRELAPCAFIDLLHGRTRNIHLCSTLLVRLLLQIDETDDLILIER